MTTSNMTLELRRTEIPRSPLIAAMERELGKPLTHECRHYLADEPVHCGTILELDRDGEWIFGRYEWSGRPDDLPTFHIGERALWLKADARLRWPE
jgi:hypothetical protein